MSTPWPPLPNGTPVQTRPVEDPSDDWTEEALSSRQWGVVGVVTRHHDSHGLTYEVKHPDESIGHYEPRELELL